MPEWHNINRMCAQAKLRIQARAPTRTDWRQTHRPRAQQAAEGQRQQADVALASAPLLPHPRALGLSRHAPAGARAAGAAARWPSPTPATGSNSSNERRRMRTGRRRRTAALQQQMQMRLRKYGQAHPHCCEERTLQPQVTAKRRVARCHCWLQPLPPPPLDGSAA